MGELTALTKKAPNFTVIDYKTSKKAQSLNELKKDMQLLVYTIAVNEVYGSKPLVGDWFLRSNEKVFFKPEDQASRNPQNRTHRYRGKNQSWNV